MNELQKFRQTAHARNLCAEYSAKWDACASNKNLADLGLEVNGIYYLCASVANRWGMTTEYLSERFKHFINGSYVKKNDGYSAEFYCRYEGNIQVRTTVLGVVECNAHITIPRNHICEICLAGECDIELSGEGQAVLVIYGDRRMYKVIDNTQKGCKRIFKQKEDEHE